MNKTVLFLVAFILLGAASYYFMSSEKEQKMTSSGVSADMDFAVKDIDNIAKIFIADRNGKTATLERKSGFWQYNGKWRARPTAINNLLTAVRDVQVSYLAPDAATPLMIKSVASQGIKVELYDKAGGLIKTYYVGGVTNDERGTYFMMEGAEQPYVVHIPSFVGQLRARYLVEEEDWRDRAVFYEKPESIQSITLQYPLSKSESFVLEKTGEAEYAVRPHYATQQTINRPMRKGIAESYLLQYENMGAEAFENNDPTRDSIAQMVPFAIIDIKKTDGTQKSVRFFPIEVMNDRDTGEKIVIRYFADCSWGDFMLVQDVVFNPIFRGYSYFFERGQNQQRLQQ